jgi:hypothetical protein
MMAFLSGTSTRFGEHKHVESYRDFGEKALVRASFDRWHHRHW